MEDTVAAPNDRRQFWSLSWTAESGRNCIERIETSMLDSVVSSRHAERRSRAWRPTQGRQLWLALSSPPVARRAWAWQTSCSPTSVAGRWCGTWWRRRWPAERGPFSSSRGIRAPHVRAALGGLDVTFVDNPDYAVGLSSSLKAGIAAVPADCDGALVLLGDMPLITGLPPRPLDRRVRGRAGIVVPTHEGRRGNPVLWPRACFAAMLRLEGDTGAKRLLAAHARDVREVDLGTNAIFADVDTPDALAEARSVSSRALEPGTQPSTGAGATDRDDPTSC